MSPERLHFLFQIPDIKQLAQMVTRRANEPVAIKLVPFQVCARVLVRVQSCDFLIHPRVPQNNRLLRVLAAGHNERLERMPVDTLDIGAVALQNALLNTRGEIKNANCAVIRA